MKICISKIESENTEIEKNIYTYIGVAPNCSSLRKFRNKKIYILKVYTDESTFNMWIIFLFNISQFYYMSEK